MRGSNKLAKDGWWVGKKSTDGWRFEKSLIQSYVNAPKHVALAPPSTFIYGVGAKLKNFIYGVGAKLGKIIYGRDAKIRWEGLDIFPGAVGARKNFWVYKTDISGTGFF